MQRERLNVFNLATRAQNQAYGQDTEKGLLEEADMGDITVGDVYNTYQQPTQPPQSPQQQQPPQQPPQQQPAQQQSMWWPVIVAAALGLGAGLLPSLLSKSHTPTVDTDTDSVTELEFYRPEGE